MISYETRLGKIGISESYLAHLIGSEISSCYGVVGMMPNGHRQRLFRMLSRKEKANTGIRVTGNTDNVTVEIHITVIYGMNINAIAASITEKVKYVVKENTGINVDRVIVRVDGIVE